MIKSMIVFVLFNFLPTFGSSASTCPPANLLGPCSCYSERQTPIREISNTPTQSKRSVLWCGGLGINDQKIQQIFVGLNHYYESRNENKSFQLTIWGTNITHLPGNSLSSVCVSDPVISDNKKLKYINSNVFSRSKNHIQSLTISQSKVSIENLMDLVCGLPNLQSINLDYNEIDELPDNGFQVTNAAIISLKLNKMKTLGNNAFFDLTNVDTILLDENKLTNFGEKSIYFGPNHSGKPVNVSITYNGLTAESFNGDIFGGTSPINLDLSNNNITHLSSSAFSSFFLPNNTIEMHSNPFDCLKCENKWLVDSNFHKSIFGVVCDKSNGKEFKDLTSQEFKC